MEAWLGPHVSTKELGPGHWACSHCDTGPQCSMAQILGLMALLLPGKGQSLLPRPLRPLIATKATQAVQATQFILLHSGTSASCFGRDAHFKPGKAPVVVLPVRGDSTQVCSLHISHCMLHTPNCTMHTAH